MVFETRKAALKGDGEAGRWLSPLRVHILPTLGKREAASITTADFVKVLRPIWVTKPDVAKKAFSRMRLIYAKARRTGVNPDTLDAARDILGDLHIQGIRIIRLKQGYKRPASIS